MGRMHEDAGQAVHQPPGSPEPDDQLLAVDIGGTGIRVGSFDFAGILRHLVTRADPADGARFDAEKTWLAVASALREMTDRGIRVRAVGVTAHRRPC